MPRTDSFLLKINMTCDWCGVHVTLENDTPPEEIDAAMLAWTAVADAGGVQDKEHDRHRWYDTLECQSAGERKYRTERDAALQAKADQDKALTAANESLKAKGFLKPQLVTQ